MGSVVEALWWQLPDEMSVFGDVRGGAAALGGRCRGRSPSRAGSGPGAVLGRGLRRDRRWLAWRLW